MKKTLLFALLVLSLNAFAQSNRSASNLQHPANRQRSLIQITDSIYRWKWDSLYHVWKNDYKYIGMVYDPNYNLVNELGQDWNNGWFNSYYGIYTYDAGNNRTSWIQKVGGNNTWENHLKNIYTYNAGNYQTSETRQSWFMNAWENLEKYTDTYDAGNNLTGELKQNWDLNLWVNSYQYLNTFDAGNNLIYQLKQTWNGSWVNSLQISYTYDSGNNLHSELGQTYNGATWDNSWKKYYSYDASNNLTGYLGLIWIGLTWENSCQDFLSYDAGNNLVSQSQQNWIGNAWVDYSQKTITYDPGNFTESETNKYLNTYGTKVIRGDSTFYYFHTIVAGTDDFLPPGETIMIYPNPGSGKFSISSPTPVSSLEIYNLPGERIYKDDKLNRQPAPEIDLSGYARGIYFIKVYTGDKNYTKKIVIR